MSHLLPLILLAAFWWFNKKRTAAGKSAGPNEAPSALDFVSEVAKDIAPFLPKEAAEAIREIAEKADQAAETQREGRPDAAASPWRKREPMSARRAASPFSIVERAVEAVVEAAFTGPSVRDPTPQPTATPNRLAIVPPPGVSLHALDAPPRQQRQISFTAMAHGRGLCSPR